MSDGEVVDSLRRDIDGVNAAVVGSSSTTADAVV